jgi:hypothetical protein
LLGQAAKAQQRRSALAWLQQNETEPSLLSLLFFGTLDLTKCSAQHQTHAVILIVFGSALTMRHVAKILECVRLNARQN